MSFASGSALRLALLLDNLTVGGTQRVILNLARAFRARGHSVDLVLCSDQGELADTVPEGVRRVVLEPVRGGHIRRLALRNDPAGLGAWLRPLSLASAVPSPLRCVPALARYLEEARPSALLSAKTYPNLAALWARRLAGVLTRLVVSEHIHLSARAADAKPRWRGAPALVRRYYPRADGVVAVSAGVAADLVAVTGLDPRRITTIYNPVIGTDFEHRVAAPADHPWLAQDDVPVLLAVGSLTPPKDYPTLLRAFAAVRARRPVRLLVLGEGRERPALEAMADTLGIGADLAMPGTVHGPEAYMARAAMLVLSSRYEGFGNVLVEALACGCPVVSTDCPSGPAEILAGGRYGALVPPGDPGALAAAIERQLDHPPDRALLRRRGATFTVERAAAAYLALLAGTPAPASASPALVLER